MTQQQLQIIREIVRRAGLKNLGYDHIIQQNTAELAWIDAALQAAATNDKLTMLAYDALTCLLAQIPIAVRHEAGWQRDGFPLPIKRGVPAADGSVTQNYRPLAIMEYVHEKLGRV